MTTPRTGQASYRYWTQPEVEKLQELVGDLPFQIVWKEWNVWAKKNGLQPRSRASLQKKAQALGETQLCYGDWIRTGEVARLLGKHRSAIQNWYRAGWIRCYRAGRNTSTPRIDLRRLARERPRLFAGCNREGLMLLLEDERLVDGILLEHPERYPTIHQDIRVLWVDRGLVFPSYSAAAKAAHVSPSTIARSIREGRTAAGLRFALLSNRQPQPTAEAS